MSYGIEFRNANGNLALESDETFARIVHSEKVLGDFSGTISVPEYDDTRGLFYVSYCVMKYDWNSNVRRADNTSWSDHDRLVPGLHPAALPSLSWDNGTKVMTIAPSSLPSAWPRFGSGNRPDYFLNFLHYGDRFTEVA